MYISFVYVSLKHSSCGTSHFVRHVAFDGCFFPCVCMFPSPISMFFFSLILFPNFLYPFHLSFPPCVRPSFLQVSSVCMYCTYLRVLCSPPCLVSLFDYSFICISPPQIYPSTCTHTSCISIQFYCTSYFFSLRLYVHSCGSALCMYALRMQMPSGYLLYIYIHARLYGIY